MNLYDGESPIFWRDKKKLTADQMKQDESLKQIFDEPTVLIDNSVGTTFDWVHLSKLLVQYDVESTGSPERDFQSLKRVCDLSVINLADRDIASAISELGELVAMTMMAQVELASMMTKED